PRSGRTPIPRSQRPAVRHPVNESQHRTTGPERTERSVSITFDRATKIYPGSETPALDALSLTVEAGELLCLVGPSGGGKTTALLLINRLIDLTSGDIRIGETSITDI